MTRFEGLLRRWLYPELGVVVLAGCLMIGHPMIADAATSDWTPVAQVRLSAPTPAGLTAETAVISNGSIAHGQSTRSSTTDVLHAALGTALAAAWLMGGAWVGMRSARISIPFNKSADQRRNARRLRFM
jgi:hypothetical protein